MPYNRHKIIAIEGVPSCGSLLIGLYRDENGEEYVQLSAWHGNGPDSVFQNVRLCFNSVELAEKFISCYPPEMAYVTVRNFYEEVVLGKELKDASKERISIPSNVTTLI